jgi:hypothetical protein
VRCGGGRSALGRIEVVGRVFGGAAILFCKIGKFALQLLDFLAFSSRALRA